MLAAAKLIALLSVIAVLVVSGVAKLRDTQSTYAVLHLLRLPRLVQQRWVAVALPVGELGLALTLLQPWRPLAILGAAAVLVLFGCYWALIARALRFTPRPNCGCFGKIGDQRVSERTLLRNTLLVALAAFAFFSVATGSTVPTLLAQYGWLVALCWVASLIGVLLIVAIPATETAPAMIDPPTEPELAADAEDYLRQPIPHAVLLDVQGTPVSLQALARQQAALLIMVNCLCSSTTQTLAALPKWQADMPELRVCFIYSGSGAVPDTGWAASYLDHEASLWQEFGLYGSPAAVLLGADALLAGGPVAGFDQVADFAGQIATQLAAARSEPQSPPQSSAANYAS